LEHNQEIGRKVPFGSIIFDQARGNFVLGYEASALQGIGAPKETPAEIVDKLNKEINAGLVDLKLKARFADLGAAVFPGSSSDFAKFIATETEKWAKVIKFSGAKAD
jgi:tripartite-type tricarboxylate transporter receptor subunit TctC